MFTITKKLQRKAYFSPDNLNHGEHSNWPFDPIAQDNLPMDALPLESLLLTKIMNQLISDTVNSGEQQVMGPNINEGVLMSVLISVQKRQKKFWSKHG